MTKKRMIYGLSLGRKGLEFVLKRGAADLARDFFQLLQGTTTPEDLLWILTRGATSEETAGASEYVQSMADFVALERARLINNSVFLAVKDAGDALNSDREGGLE